MLAPPPGAAAAAERRRLMAQYRRLKYANAFAADEGAAGARALGEPAAAAAGVQTPRRSLLASRARSRGSREGARGGGGAIVDESSKAETRAQLLSARVAAIEESEEHAASQQQAADACDRACRRDAAEERNADAAVPPRSTAPRVRARRRRPRWALRWQPNGRRSTPSCRRCARGSAGRSVRSRREGRRR